MTDTTHIPPALTPDEWATGKKEIELRYFDDKGSAFVEREHGGGVYCYRWGNAAIIVRELLSAAIALANHALPNDDPRKITREMVNALDETIEMAKDSECDPMGVDPDSGPNATLDLASSLLRVLQALLPPE